MIDTKHALEPWRLCDPTEFVWACDGLGSPGEDTFTILAADGYGVLSVPVSATDGPHAGNWERVIACVNACKGINPEAVPALLTACEDMCQRVEHHCLARPTGTVAIEKSAQRARAVIAQAQATKAEPKSNYCTCIGPEIPHTRVCSLCQKSKDPNEPKAMRR